MLGDFVRAFVGEALGDLVATRAGGKSCLLDVDAFCGLDGLEEEAFFVDDFGGTVGGDVRMVTRAGLLGGGVASSNDRPLGVDPTAGLRGDFRLDFAAVRGVVGKLVGMECQWKEFIVFSCLRIDQD